MAEYEDIKEIVFKAKEDLILSLPLTKVEKDWLKEYLKDLVYDYKRHSKDIINRITTNAYTPAEGELKEELEKLDQIQKAFEGCIVKHDNLKDIVKCAQERSQSTIIPIAIGSRMLEFIIDFRKDAENTAP